MDPGNLGLGELLQYLQDTNFPANKEEVASNQRRPAGRGRADKECPPECYPSNVGEGVFSAGCGTRAAVLASSGCG